MRGKVLSLAESEYQDRITPAYAGKRFEIGSGSVPS